MLRIIVERSIFTDHQTIGKMYLERNKIYLCDTLEDKYRDLSKEPKIFGDKATLFNEDRFTNYNKSGIAYRNCSICKKQTEHRQEAKNVLKCLVCKNISLGSITK